MFSAEAFIRTDRAGRYLTQLCEHTAQLSALSHTHHRGEGAAMAMPRRAECTDTHGVIEFDRGRCTLHATGEGLTLLVEADDRQQLWLVRDAIAARVRRIGRRDRLSVTWRAEPTAPGRTDRA